VITERGSHSNGGIEKGGNKGVKDKLGARPIGLSERMLGNIKSKQGERK